MMLWIIASCVRYRTVVAALSILALIGGIIGLGGARLDVFPEFVPSQVEIQTEAPGFAPEQVEELVTRRIEAAVNGAPGLAALRSESIAGLSVVSIDFADGVDPHRARQGIAEQLAGLGPLPGGVGTPELSPLTSSTMDLIKIGLVSDKVDAFSLRDQAEWVLKPALLAAPGVARVTVFGGAVRQVQILPDLDKLTAYGFTLSDVATAARAALALRGGGYIDLAAQRVLIDTPTPAPDIEAIGESVLAVRKSVPVHLSDVAKIIEAPALRVGDAVIQGKPGVLLSISSQFGANTLTATHAVEAVLAKLTPALEADGITVYSAMHRPANFIEQALTNLVESLSIAAALILLVLYAFLRDWRSALISFLTIPLSLIAAVIVLDRFGLTLNTMTLGGFAVALGVLVDDAVIGIENILRRLHENRRSDAPRSPLDVVREASFEVRAPVIYATLVVLAVFLPELAASGLQGRFIGPLALAFMLAVVASLFVALTTTPALAALLLTEEKPKGPPRWIQELKAAQLRALATTDKHLKKVMSGLLLAFLLSLAALPFLGGEFMPRFREGHFVMQLSSAIPGTSLDEMVALGERVSRDVLKLPFVETIEQQVGRAEMSEDTWGTHVSEFHIELKPDTAVSQSEAESALRDVISRYPGLHTEVVTFLGDRISESLTGETAQMVVNVFGDDLDLLDATAAKVARIISPVRGIVDLQVNRESGMPTLVVHFRPHALADFGVKTEDALDTLETAFAGATVGETFEHGRMIDVVMILPETFRHRPEDLEKLSVSGAFGTVALGQLAEIVPGEGRAGIQHEGGRRRIAITFNVDGRDLQGTVHEAQNRVAKQLQMPAGVYLDFAGEAEEQRVAQRELVVFSALAFVLIIVILSVTFRRRIHIWLVLGNLPFSLMGGIFAIAATGIGLTLGALVGLVTVFGISARNTILLLAHYENLVERECVPWTIDTVRRGANERLVPILMTASVTALGLLPLALGTGRPGQELQGPMAITVLGGLATSTVLNLVVLPAFARRYSFDAASASRVAA